MIITENDKKWVKSNYPKLKLDIENGYSVLFGSFEFVASFNPKTRRYIIGCEDKNEDSDIKIIKDRYEIKINFNDDYPQTYETRGRLLSVAEKKKKKPEGLHINPGGDLCLVGHFDKQANSLQDFLDGPVLQFFYDQSYYEKYNKWPRGQYSHGLLGLFENYYDNLSITSDVTEKCLVELSKRAEWSYIKKILLRRSKIKGHWPCLCSISQKKFRDCHKTAFLGLWNLQNELQKAKKLQELFFKIH